MRHFFRLLLLGFCSVSLLSFAGAPRDPYEHLFETTLGDFTEELEAAKEQGKKGVMIFFQMKDCPFCHRMKNTVLNQPEVQDYYRQHFISFDVDIEGTVEVTDFRGNTMTMKEFFAQSARNRNATPVFAFFDLNGDLVVRYTGATSGIQEFLWLGEYASQGKYKETTFTRYKREKRNQLGAR